MSNKLTTGNNWLYNVLALAGALCLVCVAFCLIAGRMGIASQPLTAFVSTVAVYFVCLEMASLQMHRFVSQTRPAQLTLFYMADKTCRLLLSAVVFIVCLRAFRLPALSAASAFVLCYFMAMLAETTYFVRYERSSKMQTK